MRRLILPLFGAVLALSACGSDSAPGAQSTPSATSSIPPNDPAQPRSKLAARAAAAKDLRQVALYILKTQGRPDRTVGVHKAVDGSWKVEIPGGAHGGTVDIALVFTVGALHQCVLPGSGCVKVAGPLPKSADPKIQHLFSDWLNILTDRQQALAVSIAQPLPGATGDCFAIESSAVSLPLPIDAGIYCYERDGTLTAARLSFGTLVLSGKPGPAPPAVTLPGPVTAGQPLPLAAPPPPSATPTARP